MLYRKTYENWKIKERTIDSHELVFITKGEGYITIEGKKYKCKKNDLIYFYPGLRHSLYVTKPPYMEFYGIHFYINIDKLPINDISTIDNSYKLKDYLKEIYSTFTEKGYMFKWKTNILMQNILFEILSYSNNRISPINTNRINKVIEYIHKNANENYTIEHLCSLSGVKKSYFIKIFKNLTGKSPIRYIIDLKLEHARDLLINSDYSVKKIGLECGFLDEFYFSRMFKRKYGISPVKWKILNTTNLL